MLNKKIFLSVIIFSVMMLLTSVIKTQSRLLEKKIYSLQKSIANTKNEIHEAQLDYFYLSSPEFISKKIKEFSDKDYSSIEYSRIYFSLEQFLDEKNKISEMNHEEKIQKK
tara:strand:- start:187 stop:519 length:333 start_codon:yes stop_codon:yes gene_type:complete